MHRWINGLRNVTRLQGRVLSTAATPSNIGVAQGQSLSELLPDAGIRPPERPAYQSHEVPVYSLPYYGSEPGATKRLSDEGVSRVLRSYGGLLRKKDSPDERRERLERLVMDRLTIRGAVVSDKMDKSVVVAARRRAFVKKIHKEYAVTRRFKAHDEYNICKEGDRVVIRSCRPLSRWKSHVVVQNFGDRSRIGEDKRASKLEESILNDSRGELAVFGFSD